MLSNTPPISKSKASQGASLSAWFSSLSKRRQALAVALVLIFLGSIVCVVGITVVGWRWPFWLWIIFLLVAGCMAVAFMGLFVRTDLPQNWKHGLSFGSALVLAIVAVVAVPAHEGSPSGKDGQSSSDGSASATTSGHSSQSTSPSPTAAPNRQTVNATTDAVPPGEDPPKSDHSGQGPLIVSAHHIVANSCSGAPGWRIPLTAKQLGTAPVDSWGNVTAKWAEKHDGIEVSGTRLELTLQGKTKSAIVIKGIEINVVDKVKPATGTHVVAYGECGGYNDSRYLVAKLDDIPPQVYEGRVQYMADDTEVVRKKSNRSFSARTFHVSKSDPEKFIFVAYGSKFDYSWQLVVRWLSPDGDEYITTVNNENGKPFSTAVQKSDVAYIPVPVSEDKAEWQKTTRYAE
jgi:hypothetical protein